MVRDTSLATLALLVTSYDGRARFAAMPRPRFSSEVKERPFDGIPFCSRRSTGYPHQLQQQASKLDAFRLSSPLAPPNFLLAQFGHVATSHPAVGSQQPYN